LNRISEDHYRAHINKAAQAIWGAPLDAESFEKIMELSERHPYYVNYLCDVLCSLYESIPTSTDVEKAWERVVHEERSDLIKDFSSLSKNQRTLMIHIATQGSEEIYSAETSRKTGIATSSISRAISSLLEQDYIEKIDSHYRIITPTYKMLLAE
jgi:Fic family protein